MKINYNSNQLRKTLENQKKLVRAYGAKQAAKITQRMSELDAATSLYDILYNRAARLHSLSGKDKNYMAIDLIHPFRLIIEPEGGDRKDFTSIKIVKIIKVVDYH